MSDRNRTTKRKIFDNDEVKVFYDYKIGKAEIIKNNKGIIESVTIWLDNYLTISEVWEIIKNSTEFINFYN